MPTATSTMVNGGTASKEDEVRGKRVLISAGSCINPLSRIPAFIGINKADVSLVSASEEVTGRGEGPRASATGRWRAGWAWRFGMGRRAGWAGGRDGGGGE